MEKKSKIYQMTTCALMAALMCVLGPMSVPIGPVPVTLTNLVIIIAIYLLGTGGAFISCAVYLLLGAVGMPVFSNYQGGLAKLIGPTGGYLIGFLFLILVSGLIMKLCKRNLFGTIIGMVIGTAVLYLFGTIWFIVLLKCELSYALSVCVFPFIPFDLGKIVIGVLFAKLVRTGLIKSHLLPEE